MTSSATSLPRVLFNRLNDGLYFLFFIYEEVYHTSDNLARKKSLGAEDFLEMNFSKQQNVFFGAELLLVKTFFPMC